MHGQSTYVPVPSNGGPFTYSETLTCPGYIPHQILPPFNPVSFPSIYGSQTGLDEAAITIKKEPNFTVHSPTGLYPEHPYHHPEHFPFPPICRPPRTLVHGKLYNYT